MSKIMEIEHTVDTAPVVFSADEAKLITDGATDLWSTDSRIATGSLMNLIDAVKSHTIKPIKGGVN